ncbi:hypothetical protein A3D76_00435 [Candidatus Roizmanbacteria bacterium RIFCSPHIGHO2_02_FULL_37_9b]|nr:MAG: hypothetical protein A3D76_00435 [Candidatus Roizmanbacteria bacterium RIFCSPHIGHO2_02_FULL_37_9b]
MNLNQIDPKIISITQLRRDIDVLNRILEQENEALIMKNQKIIYVIRKPDISAQDKKTKREETIEKAMKIMASLRSKHKSNKEVGSEYVIKMRDERANKWKK